MAAVNEDLYNWMLKTYGMPAAEWYRSNPGNKPGANPYLPKGAYVPLADAGDENTYASVSPEFEEVSVVEPASVASDYFQQFLNSLSPEEQKELQDFGLTDEDKEYLGYDYVARQQLGDLTPAQKSQVNNLLTYDPEYGEYGGYITKEDLGFSPTSVLYNKYQDAIKNIPLRYDDDYLQIGHRALYGTSPGQGSDAGYQMVLANEADRQARAKAFEDIYKNPLSQLPYTSFSAAKEAGKSLEDYRASLAQIGIDIPVLQGEGGYFVRAATAEDPEVQQFGIYNVGRVDYRTNRQNEAVEKNIEILKQQAEQGIEGSQQFLNDYVASGGEGSDQIASILPPAMSQAELYREIQTRGNATPGTKEYGELRDLQKEWIQRQIKGAEAPTGPRGEVLTAQNKPTEPLKGQKTDVYYDKQMKQFVPRVDPGRILNDLIKQAGDTPEPVDVRVARAAEKSDVQRERLAQQSEFDLNKERQLASAKAAETYRRSAANEDPFRAAARMG